MKKNILLFSLLISSILLFTTSCSNSLGKKVKEPFTSSKYQSNNKWWRASGKGESADQSIAKSKAMLNAKRNLASTINTTIKMVADQYLAETSNTQNSDLADKFQSLVREVTNQEIADLREIGNQTYINDGKYTTYLAYEIKKKDMWKFFKKELTLQKKYDKQTIKLMEAMIDAEIAKIEALGED